MFNDCPFCGVDESRVVFRDELVFAIWDGVGVVAKRIEIVPNSDPPVLRIKSDNIHHDGYERTTDEVNVIGRIIWVARRI